MCEIEPHTMLVTVAVACCRHHPVLVFNFDFGSQGRSPPYGTVGQNGEQELVERRDEDREREV